MWLQIPFLYGHQLIKTIRCPRTGTHTQFLLTTYLLFIDYWKKICIKFRIGKKASTNYLMTVSGFLLIWAQNYSGLWEADQTQPATQVLLQNGNGFCQFSNMAPFWCFWVFFLKWQCKTKPDGEVHLNLYFSLSTMGERLNCNSNNMHEISLKEWISLQMNDR